MTTGANMTGQDTTAGGWPAGRVISLVAGVVAAVLGRWLGDSNITAAVLVGLMVFLVFGVLLGMFWTAPPVTGGGGHTHHDHIHHDIAAPVPPDVAGLTPVSSALTAPARPPSVTEALPAVELKPLGFAGPRGGASDGLQRIEGIGPVLEKLCHDLGIYHFNQIAGWGPGEIAWMDDNLEGFRGRVTRDKWVRQARLIGEIGLEAFQLRARARATDY